MSVRTAITSYLRNEYFFGGKTLTGESDCADVQIKGNYIIIKIDSKHHKETILNNVYNAGKCRSTSDYVIVSDEVILVCEMKSENTSGKSVQLKCTYWFLLYVLSIIKTIDESLKIPPIKFVCFSSRNDGKQKTGANKLDYISWWKSVLYNLPCNSIYSIQQFL